jgi:hypothetical protein
MRELGVPEPMQMFAAGLTEGLTYQIVDRCPHAVTGARHCRRRPLHPRRRPQPDRPLGERVSRGGPVNSRPPLPKPAPPGQMLCRSRIVSGAISSRAVGAVLWYHAKQARSAQVSFGRCGCRPPQDGELMAQDQDFRGLPGLLTPRQPQPGGRPRGQEKDEPQAHDW